MEGNDPKLETEQKPVDNDCYTENFKDFSLENCFGLNNDNRQNFLFIDPETYIYFSGIIFSVCSISQDSNQIFNSVDGGGIGAIAVHQSEKKVAIGEKGRNPNIYIYTHPTYEISGILKGGTERGFSSLSFSKNSDKLISVGNHPDYSIVLWNWKASQILLRAKAFSQEVYRVCFSDFSDDVICTAGMAHIKFWKIANTFTGLKLKGEIGKFGGIELSDIYDMAVLNDGNVISGSEKGYLFIWEGNFIKNVIREDENKPCHAGNIDVVKLLNDDLLITGSSGNNIIKIWSVEEIKSLDSEDSIFCNLAPLKEINLGQNVGVLGIDTGFFADKLLFVQNKHGSILKVELTINENFDSSNIKTFNLLKAAQVKVSTLSEHLFGSINAVAIHKSKIAFGGQDGNLKIVDIDSREYEIHEFGKHPITAMAVDSANDLVFIGNDKGVLQSYSLVDFGLRDIKRVFESPLIIIILEEEYIICKSLNQIFVLTSKQNGNLTPFFLFDHPTCQINQIIYDKRTVIFGTQSGEIKAFKIPEKGSFNNDKNYLLANFAQKYSGKLHMMEFQKPKRDEEDIRYFINDDLEFVDVEWESQPIRSLSIFKTDKKQSSSSIKVLAGSEGNFAGYLYLLELLPDLANWTTENELSISTPEANAINDPKSATSSNAPQNLPKPDAENSIRRPLQSFKTRQKVVTTIAYQADNFCLIGYIDGVVSIRSALAIDNEITKVRAHCHDAGKVFFASVLPNNVLVSASTDSTLCILQYNASNGLESNETQRPKFKEQGILSWQKSSHWKSDEKGNIENGYSLQQEKIQSLKDRLKIRGSQIRESILVKLESIRRSYQNLKRENSLLEDHLKVPDANLEFDENQSKKLSKQYEQAIEETSKEVAYEVEYSKAKLQKLKNFFIAENDSIVFSVFKLQKNEGVESFRLKILPEFVIEAVKKFAELNPLISQRNTSTPQNQTDGSLGLNTQNLLEILKNIRKKMLESKNRDHYSQLKNKIKQEYSEYESIDKLRELRNSVSKEIKALKFENDFARTFENSKELLMSKNSFGDYKLKSLPNFTIVEKDRISVEKNETQIVLFEHHIYQMLKNFNTKLEFFRQRKLLLITKIDHITKKLSEINAQLEISQTKLEFFYSPLLEDPENQFIISSKELFEYLPNNDDFELKTKIGLDERKEAKHVIINKAIDNLGCQINLAMEIDGVKVPYQKMASMNLTIEDKNAKFQDKLIGNNELELKNNLTQKLNLEELSRHNAPSLVSGSRKSLVFSESSQMLGLSADEIKRIPNEQRPKRKINSKNAKIIEYQKILRIRLEAQKTKILEELKLEMNNFDEDLENMFIERRRLETQLKLAQIRVLEVLWELIEFQMYEEEDLCLIKDYNEKKAFISELNEKKIRIIFQITDTLAKIQKAQSELKIFSEVYKEKVFSSETEKADFIYKYFTHNYRKSKNANQNENGGADNNFSKEYDMNSIDSDRKEWILYFEQNEEWIEILKSRYEAEENFRSLEKQKALFENESQKIEEKLTSANKVCLNLKDELDRIQMLKYKRIKNLICSFLINLDQIHISYPIKNLDSSVLFSKTQLKELNQRTIELESECNKIEQDTKQLRVSKDALIKNLNILRLCEKKSRGELDENFKLKFGEVVDLDILENLKETQKVKELKKEYKDTEAACKKRIEEANASLLKAREQLLDSKRKNTEILKRITALGNNQIKLNRTLDNTNKQIFKDDKEVEKENNLNNKKDLLRVINLLNSELDELKKEIITLKTK